MTYTVGSLFSGIGGIDLGLERAGMTVRWQSENDPYCCRILAKHWPHVPNLGDVTAIDWSTVEPVDLICGGYPCQPFSLAGARAGETDARHLWPFFAAAIRHLRPRYALLENVPGHLSLGFGRVLGDLAECGYDTEWDCIPAAAVGAPHLRYRVFVVAYPHRESEPGFTVDAVTGPRVVVPNTNGHTVRQQPVAIFGRRCATVAAGNGNNWDVADTSSVPERESADQADPVTVGREARAIACGGGELADAEGERCRSLGPYSAGEARADNIAGHAGELAGGHAWAVEPDVGRVADGVPHRVDRLRALGNAVVPQVAELIGRRILEAAA